MGDGYALPGSGGWIERAVELAAELCATRKPAHQLSFEINILHGNDGVPARKVLVTGDALDVGAGDADAVVILSGDCPVQVFPSDLGTEPIRLRMPLKSVAFRVAMEHVSNRLGTGRGAAHPGLA